MLAGSCQVAWLSDSARGGKLHLPRMRDNVFGFVYDFPPPLPPSDVGSAQPASGDEGAEDVAMADAARPRSDSSSSSSSSSSSPLEATRTAGAVRPASNQCGSDLLTPRDATTRDAPDSGRRIGCLHSAAHGHAEDVESKQQQPVVDGDGDALLVAPATHDHGAAPSVAADGMSARLSVDDVLATHSKAEILLELQWARQALRERRKVSACRFLSRV